jgi:hypothetical protein
MAPGFGLAFPGGWHYLTGIKPDLVRAAGRTPESDDEPP